MYPGLKPPNDGQSAMGPHGSGAASHAKGTTRTTPKSTHQDGGGKPFARPRHRPAKNRPTTHSPNPGGSRQSQRAAATGV